MNRTLPAVLALLLPALLVGGCSSPLGPDHDPIVGFVVGVGEDDPQITVPATARAGEAFTVSVVTYGLDGCWEEGHTEVDQDGMTATVTPIDLQPRDLPGFGCTTAIEVYEHEATLTFEQAGNAVVTVRGRSISTGQTLSFEHTVVVQ